MRSKFDPNHNSRAKVISALYSAINRNDIAAAMELFDPGIVRVEPGGTPESGTYRGLAEMKANFLRGRENWAEGNCKPEEYIADGDRVIVFAHVHVRLKDRPDWIEGWATDIFVFNGDKITEMRTFADQQEALKFAGLAAN